MSERSKYVAIFIVCIALSLGGILVSVFLTHEPLDGSRGGVLAVGLAVSYLVVKRDIAGEVFETLEEHAKEETPTTDLGVKLNRLSLRFEDLKASLQNKNKDEGGLNWYLVTATLIGTLAAAFGDLAAKLLSAHLKGLITHP
jgi:hypothetical protein